mgnify:CR=1 FL=1
MQAAGTFVANSVATLHLKSLIARVSLIMGNLSAAGVNLLESIEIAKQVSNNDVVTQALENVKKGFWTDVRVQNYFWKDQHLLRHLAN